MQFYRKKYEKINRIQIHNQTVNIKTTISFKMKNKRYRQLSNHKI
jgi:hypothetical protein